MDRSINGFHRQQSSATEYAISDKLKSELFFQQENHKIFVDGANSVAKETSKPISATTITHETVMRQQEIDIKSHTDLTRFNKFLEPYPGSPTRSLGMVCAQKSLHKWDSRSLVVMPPPVALAELSTHHQTGISMTSSPCDSPRSATSSGSRSSASPKNRVRARSTSSVTFPISLSLPDFGDLDWQCSTGSPVIAKRDENITSMLFELDSEAEALRPGLKTRGRIAKLHNSPLLIRSKSMPFPPSGASKTAALGCDGLGPGFDNKEFQRPRSVSGDGQILKDTIPNSHQVSDSLMYEELKNHKIAAAGSSNHGASNSSGLRHFSSGSLSGMATTIDQVSGSSLIGDKTSLGESTVAILAANSKLMERYQTLKTSDISVGQPNSPKRFPSLPIHQIQVTASETTDITIPRGLIKCPTSPTEAPVTFGVVEVQARQAERRRIYALMREFAIQEFGQTKAAKAAKEDSADNS